MKNIIEILKEQGIEVESDKEKELTKAVAANYKTINEFNSVTEKLKTEIGEKETAISELNDQIKGLSDTSELDDLKAKVKSYEEAEQVNKERAEQQKAYDSDKARFDKLKGENEYYNEGTEKWVFEDFRKAITADENKGKSDSEIYEALVKDKDVFKSKNGEFKNPAVDTNNTAGNGKTKFFF